VDPHLLPRPILEASQIRGLGVATSRAQCGATGPGPKFAPHGHTPPHLRSIFTQKIHPMFLHPSRAPGARPPAYFPKYRLIAVQTLAPSDVVAPNSIEISIPNASLDSTLCSDVLLCLPHVAPTRIKRQKPPKRHRSLTQDGRPRQ